MKLTGILFSRCSIIWHSTQTLFYGGIAMCNTIYNILYYLIIIQKSSILEPWSLDKSFHQNICAKVNIKVGRDIFKMSSTEFLKILLGNCCLVWAEHFRHKTKRNWPTSLSASICFNHFPRCKALLYNFAG